MSDIRCVQCDKSPIAGAILAYGSEVAIPGVKAIEATLLKWDGVTEHRSHPGHKHSLVPAELHCKLEDKPSLESYGPIWQGAAFRVKRQLGGQKGGGRIISELPSGSRKSSSPHRGPHAGGRGTEEKT